MTKKTITPVAAVVGAALAGSLSAVNPALAAENPFAATELDSGYMLLAGETEGSCGEGKCGGDTEGSCGGDKPEGKCGEGKCGEGKCGAES